MTYASPASGATIVGGTRVSSCTTAKTAADGGFGAAVIGGATVVGAAGVALGVALGVTETVKKRKQNNEEVDE